MSDSTRGVYRKFEVRRTDGASEPGLKHDGCNYFVLDLDHDKHALAAIEGYAESCMQDYPALSKDLLAWADGQKAHEFRFPTWETLLDKGDGQS